MCVSNKGQEVEWWTQRLPCIQPSQAVCHHPPSVSRRACLSKAHPASSFWVTGGAMAAVTKSNWDAMTCPWLMPTCYGSCVCWPWLHVSTCSHGLCDELIMRALRVTSCLLHPSCSGLPYPGPTWVMVQQKTSTAAHNMQLICWHDMRAPAMVKMTINHTNAGSTVLLRCCCQHKGTQPFL